MIRVVRATMNSAHIGLFVFFTLYVNYSSQCKSPENVCGSTALDRYPLIDGYNNLATILLLHKQNQLTRTFLTQNVARDKDLSCGLCQHTDLIKINKGKVGAQFWVAYVPCSTQYKDVVAWTLEQIDVIRRFVTKYHKNLQLVTSADGILDAYKKGLVGGLIGLAGGHTIAAKLSVLRSYYELGVRFMSLTYDCDVPWADSFLNDKSFGKLPKFGMNVVAEMNRLGMMIDISLVSHSIMLDVLNITIAPVILSHTSTYVVHNDRRNVQNDVLEQIKKKGGIVMVKFNSRSTEHWLPSIQIIADHINHIVDVCGINCVGIGANFHGSSYMPADLVDVSKYPVLFDYLRDDNPDRWTIDNLEKLAGRNFIEVFRAVEKVKDDISFSSPVEAWMPDSDLKTITDKTIQTCWTTHDQLKKAK